MQANHPVPKTNEELKLYNATISLLDDCEQLGLEVEKLVEQHRRWTSEPVFLIDKIHFQWRPKFKDKSFLYQKYVCENWSATKISKEISCARSTVVKYLKHFGINLRTDEQKSTRRNVAYGHTKAEKKRIEKMNSLREQGYTYEQIADLFNAMSVPTRTRKGKWHKKTIRSILVRLGKNDDLRY